MRRTYITRVGDDSTMRNDRRCDFVEAPSAISAASSFLREQGCTLVGEVSVLPGDLAMATCVTEKGTYVIRVIPVAGDEDAQTRMSRVKNQGRRSTDAT